ncbi:YdcF family protein [Scytonema hofmannii FACHB-248]|uniref:YdcF family protein n=1 Tax=Scytonema hofmannii FACHB-248 TaxID=1842502 RepID=A0ABR8GTR3_9CYAN|nr:MULTISPECIES: ElyC/SanA/YdcF family protein [Nostocales]MBD2606103.1 YdcF family protein [Scytonema hofmannii FACHB-248]
MSTTKRRNQKRPKIRLLKRQEIWTLTAPGWVIAIALMISVMFFSITYLYPFLAVTSPIKTDVLVLEGWVTDYAVKQAFTEFKNGSYRQIFTTGGPVERGFYLAEYNNFATIAAATLKKLGMESEKVTVVAAPDVIKDRTHSYAIALRQWLANSNSPIKSMNLLTSDAHARRSWLIFQQVLAPKVKVGIIAAKPSSYNPNKWWTSSEGVRTVISETIAYIYALFVNWDI